MISLLIMAQLAQPLPRVGTCPVGYYSSNGYCIPTPTARNAIERADSVCPLGYYSAGSYCLKTRR